MPIGSSKLGVLGAGLVPGGSVTFNASGTWPIPPGVKKVSITGKGGTGNPGNAGNAGNPGNSGTGGAGGAGSVVTTSGGSSGNPGLGGDSVRRFANSPLINFDTWANHPQWTCPGDPIRSARGGFLCGSFWVNSNTCSFPNSDGGTLRYAQAGQSGNAGTAGNTGNPGNTGQSSSALGNTFCGGAGGNAGVAGAAGNGGTGGSAGGLGLYRPTSPSPQNAVQNKACSGTAGAGGNGGGSGGLGVARPVGLQVNNSPGSGGTILGGGGGGGAGVVNSGGGGGNGLKFRGGCNPPVYPFRLGRRGAAGTDPASTAPNLEPNNPPAPRSQYINQPQVNSPSPVPILQQFCGMRNIPTNATGGLGGGTDGPSQNQVGGSSLRFKFSNLSRCPTSGPACNNCGFAPIFTSPSPSSLFRSGAGGGGGAGGTGPDCCGVTVLGSGPGGGGGGRGNAGNAGGSSPTPSGSAANPVTFNCVPVTPGTPTPITVGTPGGQIVISWNPQ